ncbi:MAG: hypothetical protein LBR17_00285 [Bacteroidales bacterium]|nr:hypothetical protein [Bacteroidales bacterium]
MTEIIRKTKRKQKFFAKYRVFGYVFQTLRACSENLRACLQTFGACSENLRACLQNFRACSQTFQACSENFGACSENLRACSQNFRACSENLNWCYAPTDVPQNQISINFMFNK